MHLKEISKKILSKPKRKSYSVNEKLNVTERIRSGETKARLSRQTDIPESTRRGWLKEEANIKNYLDNVV